MQRLLAYQAIWGMENLPDVDLEGALAPAMDRIAAAGFDGVGVSLMRPDRATAVADAAHARHLGLEAIGFVREPGDVARHIDRARDLGAHHLNVQVITRFDRVADAVTWLRAFERESRAATLPVYVETHRGRLTNDLLFVCRVLEALPELKLTGDLSHYPLACEMPLPVPPADLARISKVLAHCWAFHGRVAGSHQVQVSVQAAQHQGWVEQFKAWWREGFANWRARAAPDAELTFMSELGPPHYAITDGDGRELCDRWTEALLLKDIARDIWNDLARETAETDRSAAPAAS